MSGYSVHLYLPAWQHATNGTRQWVPDEYWEGVGTGPSGCVQKTRLCVTRHSKRQIGANRESPSNLSGLHYDRSGRSTLWRRSRFARREEGDQGFQGSTSCGSQDVEIDSFRSGATAPSRWNVHSTLSQFDAANSAFSKLSTASHRTCKRKCKDMQMSCSRWPIYVLTMLMA